MQAAGCSQESILEETSLLQDGRRVGLSILREVGLLSAPKHDCFFRQVADHAPDLRNAKAASLS